MSVEDLCAWPNGDHLWRTLDGPWTSNGRHGLGYGTIDQYRDGVFCSGEFRVEFISLQ